MKEEWTARFTNRGNDQAFIDFQNENWDAFIDDMKSETYPTHVELQHSLNMDAITITLMNKIMDYKECR